VKTYRIYYNRKADWPQCWSIDEGTQASEINVCGFRLVDVIAESHTLPIAEHGIVNPDNSPFAWITVTGVLRIEEGIAYVSMG